jgi:hypothetical protein
VSSYHAFAEDGQAPALAARQVIADAVTLVRNAVRPMVSALHVARARHVTAERVAGLPAHLLADLGYERDWDGSIHPVRGEDV